MERGMKGGGGREERRGGGGERRGGEAAKCSAGMKLISFKSCTSSNIRIIIYLINAVYGTQVGRWAQVEMWSVRLCVCVWEGLGG